MVTSLPSSASSSLSDRSAVEDYFQNARSIFELAAQGTGGIERTIMIGGLPVRLAFAGEALQKHFLPAFAHLRDETDRDPALTIGLWDGASTSQHLTELPVEPGTHIVGGHVSGGHNERIQVGIDPGYLGLSMLDTETSCALFYTPDAHRVPSYETAFPLRFILNWWLRNQGRQIAHCGAVGTEHGGVLLTGKGGSGKSNTTLSCLAEGMLYAGDDYTVLDPGDSPYVHSLFSTAKLRPEDVQHFPTLGKAVHHHGTSEENKSVFLFAEHFANQLIPGLPVRAMLLPRVTGETVTHVEKVSPAHGLAAMAPGTLFQLPGAGREEFQAMAAFLRTIPVFRLHLGQDRTSAPSVIRQLLEELAP